MVFHQDCEMKTSSLQVPSLCHDPSSSSNCMRIENAETEDWLDKGAERMI